MNDQKGIGKKNYRRRTREPVHQLYPGYFLEPLFFLFILLFATFLGEMLISYVGHKIFPHPVYETSAINALMLVVIISPILYLFAFRPLQLHVKGLNQMREALEKGEERYRSLVESTDDSIYLVDKDCRYLFVNAKHQARMNVTEEELIGRPYGEFHSPEGTREFEKIIDTVFAGGEPIQQEHQSHRDNRHFLRTFSPIRDPFGLVEAVTVVSKDVTRLKKD